MDGEGQYVGFENLKASAVKAKAFNFFFSRPTNGIVFVGIGFLISFLVFLDIRLGFLVTLDRFF